MGEFLLAIWVFLGSLFGISHKPIALPTFIATPTHVPTRKETYTFYIHAISITNSVTPIQTYDQSGHTILKPTRENGYFLFGLKTSLNGRTAELPTGTLIELIFPSVDSTFTIIPRKGVVEWSAGESHGMYRIIKVVGQGSATITVTTAYYSAATTSGYSRTSGQ